MNELALANSGPDQKKNTKSEKEFSSEDFLNITKQLNSNEALSPEQEATLGKLFGRLNSANPEDSLSLVLAVLKNPEKISPNAKLDVEEWLHMLNLERFLQHFQEKLDANLLSVSDTLKIIELVGYLSEARMRVEEEMPPNSQASLLLEKISQNNDSYFIKAVIDNSRKLPLENASPQKKREMVAANWEMIEFMYPEILMVEIFDRQYPYEQILSIDPGNPSEVSDNDIAKIFSKLREEEPIFFYNVTKDSLLRKYASPRFSEINVEKDGFLKYGHSQISGFYGAKYNHDGKIVSFFSTEQKALQEISLEEILGREGFSSSNMSAQEFSDLLATYAILLELPFREKIETEFGINLADFNIREQVQFINFISRKTISEVARVKKFITENGNEISVRNRFRSFLSLEQSPDMGEKIISLGEKLPPETAEAIFKK